MVGKGGALRSSRHNGHHRPGARHRCRAEGPLRLWPGDCVDKTGQRSRRHDFRRDRVTLGRLRQAAARSCSVAVSRPTRIGRWSEEERGSASDAVQRSPRTRQRSIRNGTISPAIWVCWRGPTSRKPGSRTGSDEIEVADHGGAWRQRAGDPPQLTAVQHLAVRQVGVGDGELAEVDDLAHPVEQRAGGNWDGANRPRRRFRAPHRQAVNAADQGRGGVEAANSPGRRLIASVASCISRMSGCSRRIRLTMSSTEAPVRRKRFQLMIFMGMRSVELRLWLGVS